MANLKIVDVASNNMTVAYDHARIIREPAGLDFYPAWSCSWGPFGTREAWNALRYYETRNIFRCVLYGYYCTASSTVETIKTLPNPCPRPK